MDIIPPSIKSDQAGVREAILARRLFVFEKRRDGLTHQQIADAWNAKCVEEGRPGDQKKRQTIVRDIRNVMKEMREETDSYALEYRNLLVARIEHALSGEKFLQQVAAGNLAYIDRLINGSAKIAQLMGSNAPTKVAATDTHGNDLPMLNDEERMARIQAILSKAQSRREEVEDDEDEEDGE